MITHQREQSVSMIHSPSGSYLITQCHELAAALCFGDILVMRMDSSPRTSITITVPESNEYDHISQWLDDRFTILDKDLLHRIVSEILRINKEIHR
jgi:hypothetical protein